MAKYIMLCPYCDPSRFLSTRSARAGACHIDERLLANAGRQYVSVVSGLSLFVFALDQ